MIEFRSASNVKCCDKCYKALQKEARLEEKKYWPICNNANCEKKLSPDMRVRARDPVTGKPISGKFVCANGRGCRKEEEEALPICNNANCEKKLSPDNRVRARDPVTGELIFGKFVCKDGRGCRKRKR